MSVLNPRASIAIKSRRSGQTEIYTHIKNCEVETGRGIQHGTWKCDLVKLEGMDALDFGVGDEVEIQMGYLEYGMHSVMSHGFVTAVSPGAPRLSGAGSTRQGRMSRARHKTPGHTSITLSGAGFSWLLEQKGITDSTVTLVIDAPGSSEMGGEPVPAQQLKSFMKQWGYNCYVKAGGYIMLDEWLYFDTSNQWAYVKSIAEKIGCDAFAIGDKIYVVPIPMPGDKGFEGYQPEPPSQLKNYVFRLGWNVLDSSNLGFHRSEQVNKVVCYGVWLKEDAYTDKGESEAGPREEYSNSSGGADDPLGNLYERHYYVGEIVASDVEGELAKRAEIIKAELNRDTWRGDFFAKPAVPWLQHSMHIQIEVPGSSVSAGRFLVDKVRHTYSIDSGLTTQVFIYENSAIPPGGEYHKMHYDFQDQFNFAGTGEEE